MFKKIISELSFSPASVGELSTYAARLQKEQAIRGVSLLVLVALVAGQLLVCLSPSLPPYHSTPNDLVQGGFASSQSIRETYETAGNSYADILVSLGLTKDTINQLLPRESTASQEFRYIVSRMPQSSDYSAHNATSQNPYYLSKLDAPTTHTTEGWTGYSDTYGNFFISKPSGIIFLDHTPQPKQSPLTLSHSINEAVQPLKSGDQFTILLSATNTSDSSVDSPIIFTVHDLSEYATITNAGSGIVSQDTYEVIWPHQTFKPNETKTFQLTATIANPVSTKSYQQSSPLSEDCTVTLVFGNRTDMPIECPISKQVELGLRSLPKIPPTTLLYIYGTLLLINALLYTYTRVQLKEIRIIRKQLNRGGSL